MKPGIINTAKMNTEQIIPLVQWLAANGINANKMPREQIITVTGTKLIYSVVKYRQNRAGGKRPVIGGDDFFARETKTTRIRIPYGEIR